MKAFRIIPVLAVSILLGTSCQSGATTPPLPSATYISPTRAPLPTEEQAAPATGSTPPAQPTIGSTWTRPADGMVMVYVPAGKFQMGSTEAQIEAAIILCQQHYSPCNKWYYGREGPAHAVSVAGFWIDRTEVSNGQYRRCVEGGGCSEPLACKKGKPTYADPDKTDHPVVCVTWDDAQAYCEWAGARLSTEAEWEYAFRGEQGSIYPWGDSFDGSRLNYCDTNCMESHADDEYDDGYPNTAPATSLPQDTSWSGATGMSGNVSEWVADWLGAYSTGDVSNPTGPESGKEKVLKGCSWFFPRAYCRGAARPSADPGTRYDYMGFRCAGSPDGMAIAVPQGRPAVIDGTIAPEEWASARRELFRDGSELFLMHAGGYLYLGIRASTPGMVVGNILIAQGDEVAILHSSAALGTAVYQKASDTWQQVRDFSWSCRDTSAGEAAQAERAAFLRAEHWVAANARMGNPNELEYQIKVSGDTMRLAVVFLRASDPNEKIPWPTDVEDDCTKPTSGGLPKEMDFSPGQWSTLAFVVE